MKILVVEDEEDLNRVIVKRLKREGYSVDSSYDGEEALSYIEASDYDVIILDAMMPLMDGFELVRTIRGKGINIPVLFLTAKDEIQDKVKGLDLGADDYMVKPFAFEELIARIRVLIRQKYGRSSNILKIDDLTVNTDSMEVKRGNRTIDMTAKEYSILEYMMQNEGHILTREQIENHVWDYDYEGSSNMIDVYMKKIRSKVELENERKLIKTVRGLGYVIKANDSN